MRYVVSYDLKAPGKDYEKLWGALRAMKAERILESEWVLRRSNTSVTELRDNFRQLIDSNDRLLVVCIDSADWSGRNLKVKISTF